MYSRLLWRALCVLLVTNVHEEKSRLSAAKALKAAQSQRRHGNDVIANALRFLHSSKIARSHETAVYG